MGDGRGEPRGNTEVLRNTADEKAGLEPGLFQYPRQHGGNRGLAVGARDRCDPAPGENVVPQPLGAGNVWKSLLEDFLHERISSRDHVADHEHVGPKPRLVGAPAFNELDALRGELRAHWRVDVGVATGDAVPGRAREERDAAHESTADAEDVKMHQLTPVHTDFIGLSASGAPLALSRRFRLSSTPSRNIGRRIMESHHAFL